MRNDLLGGNANFITEIGIEKYNGSFTVIQLEVYCSLSAFNKQLSCVFVEKCGGVANNVNKEQEYIVFSV